MHDRALPTAVRTIACLLTLLAVPLAAAEPAGEYRWYKGNLHTHSLWSDGNDFPEMICSWYRHAGYDFLALSDHNILSQGEKWISVDEPARRGAIGGFRRYLDAFGRPWVETREAGERTEVRLKTLPEFRTLFEEPGEFLLIQAEEITDHFRSLPVHLNATNLEELIRPQGGDSVRDTIANNLRAVREQSDRLGQPILAHLNHPNFGYAITAEDMAAVLEQQFFEVYNGHPSVNHLGDKQHASVERMWDIANTLRVAELNAPPLFGLATDDSHHYFGDRGASPGRGWVMVRAGQLTAEALIAALERGDFYASSGVTLESVEFDEPSGTLEVRIDPVAGESYRTQFVGTTIDYDAHSEPVTNEQGEEIRATRRYSSDVGRVLAEVEGTTARYEATGRELYVRAVVTSSAEADNPSFEGQRKQAWTQPVGWEDHLAAAQPPAVDAAELTLRVEELPTRLGVGYAVQLVDMNDNGRLDIVIVDRQRILWLENPSWREHILIESQTRPDNVALAAHDVDGDGRIDFAVGADWTLNTQSGGTIQWIARSGASGQRWEVHPIGEEPTVHRMYFADLDGDGQAELIVAPLLGRGTTPPHYDEQGVRILRYQIPDDPVAGPWEAEVISDDLHVVHNVWPTDLNDDGTPGLLLASYEGVTWLRQDDDGRWRQTRIGTGDQQSSPRRGASEVKRGRLRDGRDYIATIEPWHGDKVVVYTRPDHGPPDDDSPWLWHRHVLDDQLAWGHAVWCADLDGDGDQELIIGVRDDHDERARRGVRIYDPPHGERTEWRRTLVDPGGVAVEDLVAGDLNGNGRLDIVAVGRQTHNVRIYWNE